MLPIALLLLILLDAGVYFYITKTLSDLSTPINIETLPFRDPYIGLDELYRLKKIKPAEYMPIINKPLVSSPVDSKKPNAAAVDDEHRYYTDFGMLSPVDRRLYVTEEVRNSDCCFCFKIGLYVTGLDTHHRAIPSPGFWHGKLQTDARVTRF